MNYSIQDIHVDTNMLTVEDIQSASRQIFDLKEGEFNKIRNQKWYHDFLRAITFGAGDRKKVISDISSISKLQQLFMQVYLQYYKDMRSELDQIMNGISRTNSVVYRIYKTCVAKIELQEDIKNFDPDDSVTLQLFLGEYHSCKGNEKKFQRYCCNIIQILERSDTLSSFDAKQLRLVQHPDVFYRCACELCAIDDSLENEGFPTNIEEELDELDLSPNKRKEIKAAVMRQVKTFGSDYFWDAKYQPDDFSTEDIILVEYQDKGFITKDIQNNDDEPVCDTSIERYSDLIVYIHNYLESGYVEPASKKKQEDFCKTNAQMVVEKTIIGMTLNPQVLFTTWGIHFQSTEKIVAVAYKDIDFGRTTVTRTDDGTPRGVYLRTKGTTTQDYLNMMQPEEFLEALQKAAHMETAETDSLSSISQMPETVKLAYGKLLVLFAQQCQLEVIETIRMIHDTKMTREAFETMMVYVYGYHAEYELDDLINEFKEIVPYPNEESISYALIQSFVALIQFSSGRCRGLTAVEMNNIDEIAEKLEISKKVVDKLIPVAQIPYRTLKQDISAKEISKATQALATVAAGVGMPVATVLGSAFLFANTWWFWFIPGVGTILAAGALGITAMTALFGGQRKKEAEMKKAVQEQVENVRNSYLSLYQTTQTVLQIEELSSLVLKAAAKTDTSIGEYLESEIKKTQIKTEVV